MIISIFSSKPYDRSFLEEANKNFGFTLHFFETHLTSKTASLAQGSEVVCAFVNDHVDREVLDQLKILGVKLIALRCAGYNNVDMTAAAEMGIKIVRVPAYSPNAVAEHTVALMLALNRKIHKAYNRVREENFSLDGLLGFDMNGKTVGIVGTGKIGVITTKILSGFCCKLLAYDVMQNPEALAAGVQYVSLPELYKQSDIITLHCPLMPETKHMINSESLQQMKDGVMIINTSRGGLIDTKSVIDALKKGKIGYLGLDVYEEEEALFFEDESGRVLQDDVFARLLSFNNVLITGHQAFFTDTALKNIAETTLRNIKDFEEEKDCANQVK